MGSHEKKKKKKKRKKKKKEIETLKLTFFVLKNIGMFLGDEEAAVTFLFLLQSINPNKNKQKQKIV